MKKQPPFEEWGYKLVPSSYGELNGQKRYNRVSFGASFWHTSDPDNIHRACTVFVQFCTNPNFKAALKKGEIKIDYPCHILDVDLEVVLATTIAFNVIVISYLTKKCTLNFFIFR
ncbi:hypothetical protein RRV45_10295 [Bacillus sp. DTU_2020_1000418_1_SI_GHA_SEK_038]|uniref:hypothetical protein n=1 Tax=Bacillus sp. DTU_2020_1000418_1_SI_GHA_SEK_038 TaxID=3077585 RepID=UPI0028E736D3|nr:hypothetical protein [Bacillus sp. DTU_2020_1000418_1_SI_GHA_SEK_038]WNS77346.1 hypothetical protein RRV45_10295 [Bacillus sp. DTU_2020_1000418_1_SI_GHA_SEK_038]